MKMRRPKATGIKRDIAAYFEDREIAKLYPMYRVKSGQKGKIKKKRDAMVG